MGKHVLTVIVGVVVGVSLLLYMFAFQVRQSEKAVLLWFGRPVSQPEPGYHLKWPWPIEEVRRFDSRIIVTEGRFEETSTRDRYNITMSLCVGWRVVDTRAPIGRAHRRRTYVRCQGCLTGRPEDPAAEPP